MSSAKQTPEQRRRHNATPASKAGRARYAKSPKGKLADARRRQKYKGSEKDKARIKRMHESEAYKAARKRYLESDRGRASKKKWARITADRREYHLDPGERDAIEAAQGGVCAICGRPPKTTRLAVDHHHLCGGPTLKPTLLRRLSIRGLLCMRCNRGYFEENPTYLRIAADYFERHLLECPKVARVETLK